MLPLNKQDLSGSIDSLKWQFSVSLYTRWPWLNPQINSPGVVIGLGLVLYNFLVWITNSLHISNLVLCPFGLDEFHPYSCCQATTPSCPVCWQVVFAHTQVVLGKTTGPIRLKFTRSSEMAMGWLHFTIMFPVLLPWWQFKLLATIFVNKFKGKLLDQFCWIGYVRCSMGHWLHHELISIHYVNDKIFSY